MIAYGGDQARPANTVAGVTPVPLPESYFLAITRVVPENNVHLVLEAFAACGQPLVYVGNWERSPYGSDLRARYRDGVERPALMTPGKRYVLDVPMRSIAYLVPRGHRLRLDIASSSFPRLERNLNTGGRNYDESAPAQALNRVFHGGDALSFVELPVLETPVPTVEEANRELVRRAAASHGVATVACLADYYRMKVGEVRPVPFARVDDEHSPRPQAFEQRFARRNGTPEQ